ncbi:hypothetical protein JK386_06220 [Nocardioides sp. zg-536]|uniref:Uncharacterized protein n=1 Tax=Nocardioides faecalis TaxID=2803858 RepID=A0A939BV26_9ACTN|nr:hypothetical protein [Nocardioides faecalis]MBM9459491.1 hypothetical protein [Nocardioides faecalis]QVI59409.1 hypothetical protein KG111_03295 [Nocardioides faecalis]
MAKKRDWRRYEAPSEVRDEHGRPVGSGTTTSTTGGAASSRRTGPGKGPKARTSRKPGTSRKPSGSSRSKSTGTSGNGAGKSGAAGKVLSGKAVFWGVIAPITIVIALIAIASNGDDEPYRTDLDTEMLDAALLTRGLETAARRVGEDVISVRLSEYALRIEYFDPNEDEISTVEFNDYSEGYRLEVSESYYEDYMPRPFKLSVVEAETMIEAVEGAVEKAEDPYSFDLRIEADRTSGEVTMTTDVSADEAVEQTKVLVPGTS